jgi:Spy/CpxP family protein refolding chaperone
MVDKRAAVKKAQIGLKALMLDDADEGKVFAAIDKVTGLKAEIQKARFRHHQQMKALLTDEQVKKLSRSRWTTTESAQRRNLLYTKKSPPSGGLFLGK